MTTIRQHMVHIYFGMLPVEVGESPRQVEVKPWILDTGGSDIAMHHIDVFSHFGMSFSFDLASFLVRSAAGQRRGPQVHHGASEAPNRGRRGVLLP